MLYFIPTPIGNLADISLRSLELLEKCDFIICEDTRVSKSLISLLNSKLHTKIKPKGFISLHMHNENSFFKNLDITIFEKNVAYLSDAGMPCISDPGDTLVKFALEKNIQFEVLPGANAALVALVSSGFCEKEFIFIGFLANKGKERQKDIEKIAFNPYPSIVYESPRRIINLIEELTKINENMQLFAMKEISKKFENKFKGKAKDLLNILQNQNLSGEWVLVVEGKKEITFQNNTLCENDILELDIPLKTKSKLLSKLNGKNPKEIYKTLLSFK